MAKVKPCGSRSKFVDVGPPSFSPIRGQKQYRRPDGSKASKAGFVQNPPEYYGEELDNQPPITLSNSKTWNVLPKPINELWEHIEAHGVLDAGLFQVEALESNKRSKRVKQMGIYHRSDRVGTISFTGSWAKVESWPSCPPCRASVAIGEVLETIAIYFGPAPTEKPERLIPSDQRVSIGVEGLPALLNLDKLNLKLTEGDLDHLTWIDGRCELGLYTLVLQNRGGIGYEKKAEIKYKNRTIGIVLWAATFKGLDQTARYEITNAELYDTWNVGTFRGEIVENFCKAIGATVKGVFRVDIAIDGPGVMKFLKQVHSREIMAVRQSAYHQAKKYVGVATDEIEGFGFGSRQSGRYFRCYDKLKENNDGKRTKGESYKQYILDFAQANGLKPLNDGLGRLEVELTSRYLKNLKGFTWEDVFCRQKLAALMGTAMDKYFDWVPAYHTDNKINRRPRVTIVDFSAIKYDQYERAVPEQTSSNRMDKMSCKRAIIDAAFADCSSEFENAFSYAENIAERHLLYPWLVRAKDDILKKIGDIEFERGEMINSYWRPRFKRFMLLARRYHEKVNDQRPFQN